MDLPPKWDFLRFLTVLTAAQPLSAGPILHSLAVTRHATYLNTCVQGREYFLCQMWDLPLDTSGVAHRLGWWNGSVQHWNALNSFQKVSTISANDVVDESTLLFGQGGKWRRLSTSSIASCSLPFNLSLTSLQTSSITHNAQTKIAYGAQSSFCICTNSNGPLLQMTLSQHFPLCYYHRPHCHLICLQPEEFLLKQPPPPPHSLCHHRLIPNIITLSNQVAVHGKGTKEVWIVDESLWPFNSLCGPVGKKKKLSITGRLALQKWRALRAGKIERRRIYRQFQNLLSSMSWTAIQTLCFFAD